MKKETELRIYVIALNFFAKARVAWEAWLAPTIVNYHRNV